MSNRSPSNPTHRSPGSRQPASLGFTNREGILSMRFADYAGPGERAIQTRRLGEFEAAGFRFAMEKIVCFGPRDDHRERASIGVFAGIHGDERAGPLICDALLQRFVADPSRFHGYELHIYPACNPWGLLFNTRGNANGVDLNRAFWKDSPEPEVTILEKELRDQRLDGMISLHTDADSLGLYGYTQGPSLAAELLQPALREASRILPVNRSSRIDGFHAANGMITDCFRGVLRPPPALRGWPFEIILETPGMASLAEQTSAGGTALDAIFNRYHAFLAHAWGI